MPSVYQAVEALAADLASARAEIKRLNDHAETMNGQLQRMVDRWERLTTVSDEAVERVAFAMRERRFSRSSNAKVDRSIPPTESELDDARAALEAYVRG